MTSNRRVLLIAVLVLSVMFLISGCKSSDYKQAVSLFDSGEYEKAQKAFEELGEFKDSEEYLEKANAIITEEKYSHALKLFEAEDYSKAISAFSALNDYKDSLQYINKAKDMLDKIEKAKSRDESIQSQMISAAYDKLYDSMSSAQQSMYRDGRKKYSPFEWSVKEYSYNEKTHSFSGTVKISYIMDARSLGPVKDSKTVSITGKYNENVLVGKLGPRDIFRTTLLL